MIAPVLKEVTAAGSGERYTFSMPEAGGVMQENFGQHRTKLVRQMRYQIFRQIACKAVRRALCGVALFPVFLFPLQIFLISALPVDAAFRRDLDNAVCHSFQNLVVVGRQNDYALEVHQTVIDSGDALQIEVVGRSVQKQYIGVEQHHAGKHAANLFAAGPVSYTHLTLPTT